MEPLKVSSTPNLDPFSPTDESFSEPPVLSAAEFHSLVVEANDTQAPFAHATTAHKLFTTRVQKWPHAVAVVRDDLALTYGELDRRTDQLARRLRSLGVGPESKVAVLMNRVPELIVGALAIMKAGGAYLPLNPAYPRERLTHMLEDAATEVLLTQEARLHDVPGKCPHVLCLDRDWEILANIEPNVELEEIAQPTNLAYVIYTSGSTGRPKGVTVPHRGLCNMADAKWKAFALGVGHRFLQFASIGFDASISEIMSALLSGTTLVLADQEALVDGDALVELLDSRRVSNVILPPSLLAVLPPRELPHLLSLVVAGEACSGALVDRWGLGRRFVNAYGPTEATVCSSYTVCQPGNGEPSIGRPLTNHESYVLDAQLRPVPRGVPGELHLGGVGITRGYLKRPALTAEKFGPHPFSRKGGQRLYRTGDLVCFRPDGTLEFLGRIDHQVKVRGVRIELGEIEATLQREDTVGAATVLARDERLVAYVVPRPGQGIDEEALKAFLTLHLPSAMIPAAFVILEELPKTPAGKVDRKALPAPSWSQLGAADEFVAPRNATEEALAEIWCQLLGLDQVGIYDNFLALGGHSLLVGQLVSRLRERFAAELSLADLFEHPTVAALADRVTAPDSTAQLPPLTPMERTEPLPLSYSQQRVWYLSLLAPRNVAYNTTVTLRFTGALDIPALESTLTELLRRHEILRTSLDLQNATPNQVIHPPLEVSLGLHDLQHLDPESQAVEAERLCVEQSRQPFDINKAPLARWTLVRLAPEEHLLIQVEHHLVHDGWSLAVLLREMRELYTAFAAGQPSPLPPLEVQFADFVLWQRQWLRGEVLERYLDYWRETLAGAPTVLELPTDFPRPREQTFNGAVHRLHLDSSFYDDLAALSRRRGATPFMTLLATFQILLQRYSGQLDMVVGSTVANRRTRESEGLIGMFVNNVAVRGDLSDRPSFEELLERVRRATVGAYAHEDLPWDMLVETLRPDRDPGRNPVFQHLFSFHDSPIPRLEFGTDVEASLNYRHNGSAKFDLDVVVIPRAEQLVGCGTEMPTESEDETVDMVWEYNRDLFAAATIEQMAHHFVRLLHAVVENPTSKIDAMPMLDAVERAELLAAAGADSDGVMQSPQPWAPLPQLIEAQVKRTPHAVAVDFEGQTLTFATLNARANQLARYFRAVGVGPRDRLAIALERSPDLLIALLASLKSGAAYIPLDPAYPRERLATMLEQADATCIVTWSHLLSGLPKESSRGMPQILCLDTEWTEICRQPATNLPPLVGGEDLAYVLFTSGSTGTPKGIGVRHQALANHGVAMCHSYGFAPGDRILQFASISFDVALEDIFPAWLGGATVVLRKLPGLDTTAASWRFLQRERMTVLNLPASYWHEWVGELEAEAREKGDVGSTLPSALRLVVVGNEKVSLRHLAIWHELAGSRVDLHNAYGPTEATITATVYRPQGGDAMATGEAMPIGRPITGAQLYLLDPQLEPVPRGAAGEIFLGGVGLARAYLDQPARTAAGFLPHLYSSEPGARLYRTGDLGRRLPDGNVEILGRVDHQVKIRGFRVEPGEIELVLARHPSVRQAAVVARQDGGGHQRLIAYLEGDQAETSALRDFVGERLPKYMVPSLFQWLEALPRLPNGKIDRHQLQMMECAGEEDLSRPPQTPAEQKVADIWASLLHLQQVGAEDDFFALGGHSLLAAQLLSRIHRAFDVEVSLRDFLTSPTVAQLANAIDHTRSPLAGHRPEALPRKGFISPAALHQLHFPVSSAQRRLWFLDRLEPGSPFYNIFRAFSLFGKLEVSALESALETIQTRHQALRTAFLSADGQPLQRVFPSQGFTVPLVDLTALSAPTRASEAHRLLDAESRHAFDLSRPSLFRATLVRRDEDDHLLFLGLHHIICDGWSLEVLYREIEALYQSALQGHAADLEELSLQAVDFSLREVEWLASSDHDTQLTYWRQRLEGVPDLIDLPLDRPRPAVQTFNGAMHEFTVPEHLVPQFEDLCREAGVTPFMALLAIFKVLLARLGDQEDIVVGTAMAQRNWPELEALIGLFVNNLVLRTDFSGNPSWRQVLARVRQTTLGAFGHQDLPFEKLVEEVVAQRDTSRQPLFQVMFVLQNTPRRELSLSELLVEPMDVFRDSAKFDLTLSMEADGDALAGCFNYNTDLFDAATIELLGERFQIALKALVSDPDQPVSAFDLLTPREHQQILVESDPTLRDLGPDVCIHELFEAWVEKTPESLAVAFEDERWSYATLNRRAENLALHLRNLGVEAESPVGLFLEPSPLLLVAILGILKAGGAYVPLDPLYPTDRVAFMLEDSQSCALVTRRSFLPSVLEERMPADRIVDLDQDLGLDNDPKKGLQPPNAARRSAPGNLAYVIYTSGSTGLPKGVKIHHRGVVNTIRAARKLFPITSTSRVMQAASPSFDISVLEIYMALSSGASLAMIRRENLLSSELLTAELKRHQATAMAAVPAVLALLVDADLPLLETVCSLGEACPPEVARRLTQRHRFLNFYAPTEATVFATAYTLEKGTEAPAGPAPLGGPIDNAQVLLLDRTGRQVPNGLVGELYLGGTGLARGYLRRPATTAQHFVPDPFTDLPGKRLYKTGDLARRTSSGELIFLGRVDHQVKVRGYRVELGEIEILLERHSAVQSAVVVVREDRPGDQRLVAYVVPEHAAQDGLPEESLRQHLKDSLPTYMIPATFVALPKLPRTPSDKVDRTALPKPEEVASTQAAPTLSPTTQTDLERRIIQVWRKVLGDGRHIGLDDNFFDVGGHSLLLVRLQNQLKDDCGLDVPLLALFSSSTVRSQARNFGDRPRSVAASVPRSTTLDHSAEPGSADIAIIAMAGRFPGAQDLDEFWHNLRQGEESISTFDDETLEASGVADALRQRNNYVAASGVLEGEDLFDAAFFGFTAREAAVMNPQHRLFLECTWEALERAGHDPSRYAGRIGVYGGMGLNDYWTNHLLPHQELVESMGAFQMLLLNDKDYLPTRVSYKLDLKGPSVSVQTACSTSLVAVHLACRGLLEGSCEMALAGGVSVRSPQRVGYLHQAGGIMSPDGHCRAFDAEARGTVGGNGLGVVVLKRLADVRADGDTVLAVIRGSAINNDGSPKVGFTAPSAPGQALAIAEAQRQAGVDAATISYLEAHGTGTELGDPIEMEALQQVFAQVPAGRHCAIGSVKTNIGHLDSASGVAGLIKTVLALQHREIPPSLHFERPNPKIDFEDGPFFVNNELRPWQRQGETPRRAGVSSFGIGGTNAHLVVEEAPELQPNTAGWPDHLLLLSARTPTALETMTRQLADDLRSRPDEDLPEVAHTLQVGRRAFPHRRMVVCHEMADAVAALEAPERLAQNSPNGSSPPVVFLFPGQGTQYAGMAAGLYEHEPLFRQELDLCADILSPDLDLKRLLFPPETGDDLPALEQTENAQPTIFAVEYALARLLMSWGVEPEAMLGHSLGEYLAACLAGVFSLEDALQLVAWRGREMQKLPTGAMVSVQLPAEEVEPYLSTELSLAASNTPSACVVSGHFEAIEECERRLAVDGVGHHRLHTSHAFHSAMMEPLMEPFERRVAALSLNAPRKPFLSNLTGTWITVEEATSASYWAAHLRRPVRFSEGVRRLVEDEERIFLELGPGRTLSTLVRAQTKEAEISALPTLRHPKQQHRDTAFLLGTLGRLWLAGVDIDWAALHAGRGRRRVPLPTYPFERQSYWVSLGSSPGVSRGAPGEITTGEGPPLAAFPRQEMKVPYAPPQNELETTLAEVWQEVLGVERVGIHDDFFDLGGNSLVAVQLMSRLQELFPVETSVEALFDAPKISAFAPLFEDLLISRLEELEDEEANALLVGGAA